MRLTRLKLRHPVPHHSGGGPWQPVLATQNQMRSFEFVTVVLPPKPCHWPCGSEFVWRVPRDEVLRILPDHPHPDNVSVCEHMVEAD